MASLDSLPADQRAVLQLVLQRGRTYDDIAQLLSIDRAAVRERALSAFDALGPQTRVPPERRALITDYLLGQLPTRVSEDTRNRLAQSAGERAWARVVASELTPLARGQLPEIPVESVSREQTPPPVTSAPAQEQAPPPITSAPAGEQAPPTGRDRGRRQPEPAGTRRSSRVGGAVLLGGGALVVVAVVAVILIASSGSSNRHTSSAPTSASASTPTSTTATTSTTAAKPIAQVNLLSPAGGKKTVGVAEVIKQGSNVGLVIVARGVPANTSHDAYAVWLYNSPSDSHILGFVNPAVKTDGKLQTEGVLPADASHFKHLLVTLETQAKPSAPGTIVLTGVLNLPSA
jgi:hypothetical protein